MPRAAKVTVEEALDAICLFSNHLKTSELPAYTHEFYTLVSKQLNNKWSAHNIYTSLRENRKNLKSLVFKRLGIEEAKVPDVAKLISDYSDDGVSFGEESFDNINETENSIKLPNSSNKFNLVINNDLWLTIAPVTKEYKGRDYLVLAPGEWSDVVADEFWLQYRLPCAYSFKKCTVSLNPLQPYLKIEGKCKSKVCNNIFLATAKEEPPAGGDLWLEVFTEDTRLKPHDKLKRQLKNKKRQIVGQQAVRLGAANCRRKIANKIQKMGDVEAPILYNNEVIRKLIQEVNDKELGVDSKDGSNPILILQTLKYKPPYAGTIREIALDKFFVHYILPEQVVIYKEYFRLFPEFVSISLDSTGSLVLPLKIAENISSPHIFLYEIVINFLHLTVSVGQYLSAAQDANTLIYFLNEWLKCVDLQPKEAVCDYSRALLSGLCRSFNGLTVKQYVHKCFSILENDQKLKEQNDDSNLQDDQETILLKLKNSILKEEYDLFLRKTTFLRVDVAHLIAIFCRLKCLAKGNSAVKDFFIRCVALMISCTDFEEFENLLLLTLTTCSHKYGGLILKRTAPSPAEEARCQLLNLIENAKHQAIEIVPDESSDEFQLTLTKLSSCGLDPSNADCFINQSPDVDDSITKWIKNLKQKAKEGSTIEHSLPNPYYNLEFFKYLSNLALEFPLWTAVMKTKFKSNYIRPSSCFVEGDFNELKNSILKGVQKSIRIDKFFKIHYEALKSQNLLASAKLVEARMLPPTTIHDPRQEIPTIVPKVTSSVELSIPDELSILNKCRSDSPIMHCSSPLPFISNNEDLLEFDNWRNKGKPDDIFVQNNTKIKDENICQSDICDTPLRANKFPVNKNPLDKIEDRKPSKFFRSCPYIKSNQNSAATTSTKLVKKLAKNKLLLKNGCRFLTPTIIDNQKYFIKLTCPFDSITQILATAVLDFPEYLLHLQNSENHNAKLILLLLNSGVGDEVYTERCRILKDFTNPYNANVKSEAASLKLLPSPNLLKSLQVDCNISEMWRFMFDSEPSAYRMVQCTCGNFQTSNISHFDLNAKIVAEQGFQNLEKAIVSNWGFRKNCECGRKPFETININAHVFIDTDVRMPNNLMISKKCRASEFPNSITLYGTKCRLAGIILFDGGNHYKALCTRKSSGWEVYDDMANYTANFENKKEIQPGGAIYIRNEE